MSPYDVTPDDDPLDVTAVAGDDTLVERLRHSLSPDAAVVWDDDDELDPAFALLRSLQADVASGLPEAAPLLPRGVTLLQPRRRRLGRGATVAAVAAGVLSIAGVAAASAPGQPLAGVRSAVSSAVSGVVNAITPDKPVGPAAVKPVEAQHPSPKASPRGDAVSAAARSASAVLQVTANLDRAATFLDAGKYSAARNQLAAAARKLPYVADPSTRAALATRLSRLQARLAANPTPKPSHGSAGDNGSHGNGVDGNSGSRPDKSGQGNSSGHPTVTHAPAVKPSRSSRTSSDGSHGVKSPAGVPSPDASKTTGDEGSSSS
jgi:hypothetical protein